MRWALSPTVTWTMLYIHEHPQSHLSCSSARSHPKGCLVSITIAANAAVASLLLLLWVSVYAPPWREICECTSTRTPAITFPCESSSQSSIHPNCSSMATTSIPEARGSRICRWPLSDKPLLGLHSSRSTDGARKLHERDPADAFHIASIDLTARCGLAWNARLP